MGIKLETPQREIRLAIKNAVGDWQSVLLNRLTLLGDLCYQEAMNRIGYTHRTGNLGSSTGYIVLNDGQIHSEGGFLSINGPDRSDTTEDGTLIGRTFAESLIPEYSNGFVMIFVAGMYYAGYVEAKGYNVITSAEIWAQREAINVLNRVGL